jgi:hypothetical protein
MNKSMNYYYNIPAIFLACILLGAAATAASGTPTLTNPTVQAQSEQQSSSISSMAGGFAEITTTQTDNQIIITITRDTSFTPPPEGEGGTGTPETPEGPIIIVPDPSGEGNGTIIIPEPPANETTGEVPAGNVTVIEPGGNITQIEPPTNVTVIDNNTVVVAPPNQTVTETPGNVTVIDPPPPANETAATEPCGCPSLPPTEAVSGPAPDIQFPVDNMSTPLVSNNTNITITEIQPAPPAPIIPPVIEPDNGNNNNDGGNGDGNNNDG